MKLNHEWCWFILLHAFIHLNFKQQCIHVDELLFISEQKRRTVQNNTFLNIHKLCSEPIYVKNISISVRICDCLSELVISTCFWQKWISRKSTKTSKINPRNIRFAGRRHLCAKSMQIVPLFKQTSDIHDLGDLKTNGLINLLQTMLC